MSRLSLPLVLLVSLVTLLSLVSVASSQGGPIPLTNGRLVSFDLPLQPSTLRRYSITIPQSLAGGRMTVGLNAFAGDPDLYVTNSTTGGSTIGPTDYVWMDDSMGGGVIIIQPIAAITYYIAVYAGKGLAADATLTAHAFRTDDGGESLKTNPLVLSPGSPLVDYVPLGQTHYYSFEVTTDVTYLNFMLSRRSGDPDIFIAFPGKNAFPSINDPTSYDDSRIDQDDGEDGSAASYPGDVIRVANPARGTYRIAVHAWNGMPSKFGDALIYVAFNMGPRRGAEDVTASHLRVSDGISYPFENVKDEYQWAQLYISGAPGQSILFNQTVTVTVTVPRPKSNEDTDIDIYCSYAEHFPTAANIDPQRSTDFSSTGHGFDYIPIKNPAVGYLYCGFHPWAVAEGGTYQVLIAQRSEVVLQHNWPQNEVLEISQPGIFAYEIPNTLGNGLLIYTQPQNRSVDGFNTNTIDLYVGQPTGAPIDTEDGTSYQATDKLEQPERTYMSHNLWISTDSCAATAHPCRYSILTLPTSRAAFQITVWEPSVPLVLQPSGSVGRALGQWNWDYFRFTADAGATVVLTVVNTALIGLAPDLFVSSPLRPQWRFPTYTQSEWKRTGSVGSPLTFTATVRGVYYVSVFTPMSSANWQATATGILATSSSESSSSSSSTGGATLVTLSPTSSPTTSSSSSSAALSSSSRFSSTGTSAISSSQMLSSSSSAVTGPYQQLPHGEPVQRTLGAQDTSYFSFTITENTQVTITLLAQAGDPDLYVTKTALPLPSEGNAVWKSTNGGLATDQVIILQNDPNRCNPNQSGGSCTYYIAVYAWDVTVPLHRFTITAHTSSENVVLGNGVPYERTLRSNEAEYYTFANAYIGIGTVVFGVAALSGDPDMWVSASAACQRPSAVCFDYASTTAGGDMIVLKNATSQTYFIGIRSMGGSSSRYSLVAQSYNPTQANSLVTTMVRGLPIAGYVARNEFRRFSYTATTVPSKLVFYAARRLGDPNIYINGPNRNGYPNGIGGPNGAEFSANAAGDDILAIRNVTVGVYKTTITSDYDSQFTLMVTEGGQSVALADGQPYGGDIALREYDYVTFTIPTGTVLTDRILTITINVLTMSGMQQDPDAFCSDVNPRPIAYDFNSYNWSTASTGGRADVIKIERPDLHVGTYYCAVYGFSAAKYIITANLASSVILQAGIPQQFAAEQGGHQYFTFSIAAANAQNFTINTIHDYGVGHLYVSLTGNPEVDDPTSYQWWSESLDYAHQSVSIPGSSCRPPVGQASCTYYVLVYAVAATSYSILAETATSSTTLSVGQTFDGQVSLGGYRYYIFNLASPDAVTISVTALSGDPDMFVSRTVVHPTARTATWRANTSSIVETVVIPQANAGPYYISVFGVRSAVFRILVTLGNSAVDTVLTDGVPVSGNVVNADQYHYFTFRPAINGWPYYIQFTLQRIRGDPDLYISNTGSRANSSHYKWHSATGNDFDRYTIFANDTLGACNPLTTPTCSYSVGVLGFVANSEYILTVSTSNANGTTTAIQLTNGQSVPRILPRNAVDYFYFVTPTLGWTVNIAITPMVGDPNLYVSATDERPGPGATWTSARAGVDVISISNAQATRYYIGVQANDFTGTEYTILVSAYGSQSNIDSPIALVNALPQLDLLGVNSFRYYTYTLSANVSRLVLGVVTRSGTPRLLANLPSRPNFPTNLVNADYNVTTANGNDVIGIMNPPQGQWKISVYSQNSASLYEIIAVRADSLQTLQDRTVFPGYLFAGQYAYYQFVASPVFGPYADKSLTFALTALSGDPDIYCSDVDMYPNSTTYKWSSSSSGSDSIQLSGSDGGLHAGTFYCAVYAWSATTYHIQALLNTRIPIVAGQPIVHGSQNGQLSYFSFTSFAPNNASDFTITVNALYGIAYLYVSRNPPNYDPDPDGDYTWTSQNPTFMVQSINIPAADCRGAGGSARCHYSIVVYTPQASSYQILISTNNVTSPLTSGISQRAHLLEGEWAFYSFTLTSSTRVTVTLTGTGDPDMFIRRGARPTTTNYEWLDGAAAGAGEFISFDQTDPHFQGSTMAGTYYVGVLGFRETVYTILLTLAGANSSTQLSNGQSSFNVIGAGQYQQFTFRPPALGWPYTLSIALTPITGDPDLFINSNGVFPTSSANAQWHMAGTGTDQVLITAADPNACNPVTNTQCQYYITVFGYTASQYAIVASASYMPMQLTNGVSTGVRALPANGWDYFYLVDTTNTYQNHTVIFSVNSIGGDPDIYVSNITAHPSQTNFTYKGEQFQHDLIIIKNSRSVIWFVGVYSANNEPCEYSISGLFYDPLRPELSAGTLREGVARQDGLPGNEYRYYSYQLNHVETATLTFQLLHQLGDPDIYVNYWGTNDNTKAWPTDQRYNWTARQVGSDILSINNPQQGWYGIGVHAADGFDTTYQIVVTPSGSTQVMSAGQSYRGMLKQGQTNYYRFTVLTTVADADLAFILTTDYGDADIYVSRTAEKPSATNFEWASTQYGGDSIILSNRTQPGSVRVGLYYIAVYAYEDISYTIVASHGSRIILRDGSPQQTTLRSVNHGQYYEITVPGGAMGNDSHPLTIQTSVTSGQAAILIGLGTEPKLNDPSSIRWQGVTPAFFVIPRDVCAEQVLCTFFILAYAMQDNTALTMLASTGSSNIMLQAGQALQGDVTQSSSEYYQFYLNSNKANVTVRLTTISGNADLYCSYRYTRPSASYNDWSSAAAGTADDVVYFDYMDPVFRNGQPMAVMYYCAVTTPVASSIYRIVYSVVDGSGQNSTVVRLNEGQPQAGSLNAGQFSYYSFTPSSSNFTFDIFFTLTALEGNPDLYIRNDGKLPSLQYYQWKSDQDGGAADQVTVRGDWVSGSCSRANITLGRCTYTIAVFAASNQATRFQLTVSTSRPGAPTALSMGIPVAGTVRFGPNTYNIYTVNVEQDSVKLTVIVTALSGNPDLVWVSSEDIRNPHVTEKEFGSDVLTITATRGTYYFGVIASRMQNGAIATAHYVIVATMGPIRLLPGMPQDDAVDAKSSRLYSVAFNGNTETTGHQPFNVQLIANGELTGVSIYVRNDGHEPTSSSYQWSATPDASNAGYVIVDPSDPYYSVTGTYQILVISASIRSSYTILATEAASVTTLSDGRPFTQNAPVASGDYRYFRGFAENSQRDLEISVTVPQGSVTVYISTTSTRPSASNAQYTLRSGNNGGGTVVIPRYAISQGYYYLGVRTESGEAARYSVVLTTSHVTAPLGTALQGSCDGLLHYYRVNLGSVTLTTLADINMLVTGANTAASGYSGAMKLYVQSSTTNGTDSYPNQSNFTWQAGDRLRLGQAFVLPKTDALLRQCITTGVCGLYIGITCGPTAPLVSYYFTVSVGKSIMPVSDAEYRSGVLKAGDSDHYVSYTGSGRSMLFQVDSCTGNADLFVSAVHRFPARGQSGVYSSVRQPPYALDSVFVSQGAAFSSVWYSSVYAQTGAMYRFFSMSTNATGNNQIMPSLRDTAYTIARSDRGLEVTFFRATLPAFYAKPPAGVQYTLRYSLYATENDDDYSMYSACGLTHGHLLGTILDSEIDAQNNADNPDPYQPGMRSDYGTLVIDAKHLMPLQYCIDQTDPSSCHVDTNQLYKMNIVVHVLRAKGMTVQPTVWAVYQPTLEFTLADYPAPGDSYSGGSSGIDMTLLLAIGIPLIVVLLCIGFVVYKRRNPSSPSRSGWGSATQAYASEAFVSDTSSRSDQWDGDRYNNGHHDGFDSHSHSRGRSASNSSAGKGKSSMTALSSDMYAHDHEPVSHRSTSRFSGFGSSDSNGHSSSGGSDWYNNDRYAIPTVEIAETNGHYQPPTGSSASSGYGFYSS